MASFTLRLARDEITPAIDKLMARLQDPTGLVDELGWMAHEHVVSRMENNGRANRFAGRGGQKRWQKPHQVTKRIRAYRGYPPNNPTWHRTGAAAGGIVTLKHTAHMVEIGWPFGAFKNDYPYRVDGGVPCTGGIVPGKTIRDKEVLYVTDGFVRLAVKAGWRWWLSAIGVARYQ